jgi:transposase
MTSKQETNRQFILQLWNQDIRNAKEIHSITNISLSTIYDNIDRLKKTSTNKHAGSEGRPKKITARASRALGQHIRRDSSISTRTLATKLLKINVELSHQTVGRHLATLGYKKALPIGTPMLTDAHKRKRVEWAQKHLNDDWNDTFFSDETAFQLFRNTVERWYKGARPIRRIPKDRTKIFAWGGFCIKGKSSLFCFSEIMDAKFYVDILRRHTPEIEQLLGDDWRFQQDNDPKHTSRVAKEFLEETMPEVLDWPSNSPDLNPIENLWCIVKNNVEKCMPKNSDELRRYMIKAWRDIPESTLINLVGSMKQRCELIIECDGERIAY